MLQNNKALQYSSRITRPFFISSTVKSRALVDNIDPDAPPLNIDLANKTAIKFEKIEGPMFGVGERRLWGPWAQRDYNKINEANGIYVDDIADLNLKLLQWKEQNNQIEGPCAATFIVGGLHSISDIHSCPVHVIYKDGEFHAFSFDSVTDIPYGLEELLGNTFATVSVLSLTMQHAALGCRQFSAAVSNILSENDLYRTQLVIGAVNMTNEDENHISDFDNVDSRLIAKKPSEKIHKINQLPPAMTYLIGDYDTLAHHIKTHSNDPEAMAEIRQQLDRVAAAGNMLIYHPFIDSSLPVTTTGKEIIQRINRGEKLFCGGYKHRALHNEI